jgi:chromosome segregation ATPase
MVVGYGFPEPGNLRSKNKKEIKKTIKCFSAMLQQRDSDIQFRKSVNDKFRKMELELSSEQRKNQTLVEKKAKLDREVTRSKNIISSTKDKIKDDSTKVKQEVAGARKLANDLKHKTEMLEKELKRKDKQIEKLNEQMRNIIDKKIGFGRNVDDWDYKRYENGMELVSKLKVEHEEEKGGLYKYIPEHEFMEMQKTGFEDNHTELLYENDVLRACIVRLQSELNNFMAYAIEKLREYDADTKILNHLAFDKFKMIKLQPMRLELPKNINGDRVKDI